MSRSKSEIREQRGKFGCVITILIPIILVGGYLFWTNRVMNEFGESIEQTVEHIVEKQINKEKKKDKALIYKEILGNNQIATFTGIEKINDTTFTNALIIKSRDSSSIEYRIESLVNWKSKADVKGIAILDNSTLGNEQWKIEDREGNYKSAFRFIDNQGTCQIEILISKGDYRQSSSIVEEVCRGKARKLTVRMNYK